jgi:hypothetical protein
MKTEINCSSPQAIAARIVEEDAVAGIAKLLVLVVRKNGSSFSMDNGLTADEAKTLTIHFHSWLDQCLGREQEKDGD